MPRGMRPIRRRSHSLAASVPHSWCRAAARARACALVLALAHAACADPDGSGGDADSDAMPVDASTNADSRGDADSSEAHDGSAASNGTWTAPAGPHLLGDRDGAATQAWAAPWPDSDRGALRLDNPAGTALVNQLLALQGTGAGVSSGVFFPSTAAIDPNSLPASAAATLEGDPSVVVQVMSGPRAGERLRAQVGVLDGVGPHAPAHALVVQPVQGWPWPADTEIEVVVTTRVQTMDGEPLSPSGWSRDAARPDGAQVAAVARFRTADPTAEFLRVVEQVRSENRMAPRWVQAPVRTEAFDDYCVWQGTVAFTQFQQGFPPFDAGGGNWELDANGGIVDGPVVESRVWFTVPQSNAPESGWGVVQFVRTGGGGDRPLIDRGVRDAQGNATPGTGLAVSFAQAGWVGLQFDGPHGGARNPNGSDEQFLMFNITQPQALRDNIRQTALEVAVLSEWLTENAPALGCGDATGVSLDAERQALFGHSMGATVAPLAAAAMPELDLLVLSGAGGSWIENVLYKLRPLATRPIAETLLGYPSGTLTRWDPVLNLLQAVGEAADPQVYAPLLAQRADLDVLMVQGIADTYILPPIANSVSLPLGLTLGGEAIEALEPESAAFAGYLAMDPWAEPAQAPLPIVGAEGQRLAVLVQHQEDGVEDGHEVAFQRGDARRQIRCFLDARRVVEAAAEETPCTP
jgi:hypothetical protein